MGVAGLSLSLSLSPIPCGQPKNLTCPGVQYNRLNCRDWSVAGHVGYLRLLFAVSIMFTSTAKKQPCFSAAVQYSAECGQSVECTSTFVQGGCVGTVQRSVHCTRTSRGGIPFIIPVLPLHYCTHQVQYEYSTLAHLNPQPHAATLFFRLVHTTFTCTQVACALPRLVVQ